MIGAAVIVFVVVIFVPVSLFIAGGGATAVIGFLLKTDAEDRNEDSELLETNY